MNDKLVQRKPRQYFDTVANPSHVTFDDGKEQGLNFPWSLYVETRWQHAEPDLLRIEIGDHMIFLRGHNLGPLKQAIEEHTLLRVCCRPELEEDRRNEPDSFVTRIVFRTAAPRPVKGTVGQQGEFNLTARQEE